MTSINYFSIFSQVVGLIGKQIALSFVELLNYFEEPSKSDLTFYQHLFVCLFVLKHLVGIWSDVFEMPYYHFWENMWVHTIKE